MNRTASLLIALVALAPTAALATERHFTYTYETGVLPPGAREVEIWTTAGIGRAGPDSRYEQFDHRVEFEIGLTDRLQTSLYLNLQTLSLPTGGEMVTSSTFTGVSNEWKYKVLDPVANAVGLAFYGELGLGPSLAEFETKVLLDKRMGPWLLAANAIFESETEFAVQGTQQEWNGNLSLGASYFLMHNLSLGLEAQNLNVFREDGNYSALFAGPVISYNLPTWWVSLTVMPQLPALKTPAPLPGTFSTSSLVLNDQERYNARLLFAFHI
jgi:hypothetical protein